MLPVGEEYTTLRMFGEPDGLVQIGSWVQAGVAGRSPALARFAPEGASTAIITAPRIVVADRDIAQHSQNKKNRQIAERLEFDNFRNRQICTRIWQWFSAR